MTAQLANKTAIVTGSTSGIGLGLAKALAAAGANVMLNGLGEAAVIEASKRAVKEAGAPKVSYHGADMRKADEIRALVAACEKEFGAVDILVNNAGIQFVSPIVDLPDDKWEDIISINLSAAFYATKAALPGMQKRKWGRVINIASVHGLVASVDKSAYVAAKHGIVGLTKVTALEHARHGITANAICPGYVMTPLVQKQVDAYAQKHNLDNAGAIEGFLAEKHPTRQFTTVEQLGALAVFLASDSAQNMTGVSLPMDGGWVTQ